MQELINRIRQARSFVLISHIDPDGDAVGSLLGLTLALRSLGKEVHPVLASGVPGAFLFLQGTDSIATALPKDEPADLAIILDAGDVARTGYADEFLAYAKERKLAFVDHHPRGDLHRLAQAHLHRLSASSTAELAYELVNELGIKLTPAMSTAFLTGLYTDTGGFQYVNTTPRTLDVAAELMKRGGKLSLIVREVSRRKSVASLKLLGLALDRLTLTRQGTCAVSVITAEDVQETNATSEDVLGIIGQMNVLPEVKMCVLLVEKERGVIRGSFRTGEGHRTNVSRLARLLGGGGHPRAAGFTLAGHIRLQGNRWKAVPVEAPLES